MKLAQVSLDYYHMNSKDKCHTAGARTASKNVDFASFSEVRTDRMREGLVDGLGENYSPLIGAGSESPQVFNTKRWKLTGFRVVGGVQGEDGITPTLRFVVGTYQNIRQPRKVIEYVSTHFPPLTIDGKPRERYELRWSMWQTMWRVLKTIVADALKKGHTIFVSGDFNHFKASRRIIKQIHRRAKWVIRKGLDWVFVVTATRLRIAKWGLSTSFASGSDHRAQARIVTLR